jgi:hypothetical protein
MSNSKRLPFFIFAIGEWLMVLPATVLLLAGALRLMQPRAFEPARTSWILYEWTQHMPHLWAGILFIGIPAFVAFAGLLKLFRTWREDHELRREVIAGIEILRHQAGVLLLGAATLLSGVILMLVLGHILTD